MKLLDLYESILNALGYRTTKDGKLDEVSPREDGTLERMPALIEGKRLILPTTQNMRAPDSGDTIVFHPMWEDVLKGPSVIIENLRKRIIMTLNDEIATMVLKSLMLIVNKDAHERLSPDQSTILDNAKKADEETLKRFTRIIKASETFSRDKSFIHLYLRRGGKIDSDSFRQLSVVSFPMYEALVENPKRVFGVQLRIADQQAIREVLEYLLPRIGTPNAYSFGSNSDVAPKFEALAGSFNIVLRDLLTVDSLLKSGYEDIASYGSDVDYDMRWADFIGNTSKYLNEVRMIPKQRGNEGIKDVNTEGFTNVQSINVERPTQPSHTTSVELSSSEPEPKDKGLEEIDVIAPVHNQSTEQTTNHQSSKSSNVDVGSAIRSSLGTMGGSPHPAPMPAMAPGYPYQANPATYSQGFSQRPSGLQFVGQPMGYPNQPQGFPMPGQPQAFSHNVPYGYYGR